LSVTGELLVGHAKKILQTHKDACTALSRPDLIGRVRLGSPEDYTALFLPRILAGFADVHPNVQVTLTCEPTPRLVALLNKCELDIAILTAADGNAGRPVHRERVVWVASKDGAALKRDPLPLALYNYNSIYRQWAEKMLVHSGINYCTAFLSPSISGILAAVRAGSAVAPVGRSIVPTDLRVVGEEQGLPELPQANVTLRQSLQDEAPLLACLAEQIEAAFSLISPGDCAG
jgi:DNA-binding transcriptional LysR family regulator